MSTIVSPKEHRVKFTLGKEQRSLLVDKVNEILRFPNEYQIIPKENRVKFSLGNEQRLFLVDKVNKLLRFPEGVPEFPLKVIQ